MTVRMFKLSVWIKFANLVNAESNLTSSCLPNKIKHQIISFIISYARLTKKLHQ